MSSDSDDIATPADATPGKYHLMIYCTDAPKNETHPARNIVLDYEESGQGEDQ